MQISVGTSLPYVAAVEDDTGPLVKFAMAMKQFNSGLHRYMFSLCCRHRRDGMEQSALRQSIGAGKKSIL